MGRTLIGAALACVSTAAAQDAPPENGLGPYHFGMSVAAIEATSQHAWRVQDMPGRGQVLSGGPPVTLDAGSFQASLVFEQDALHDIVLTGGGASPCATLVPALVTQLEPTFGVFSAAAGVRETKLNAVSRTPGGSEIRSEEDENGAAIFFSTHRSAMFISVTGRGAPNSSQACQVSITFNAQAPYSGPTANVTYDELDHAQTLVHPFYTERPGPNDFAVNFPRTALQAGIQGKGVLLCIVNPNGRLRCLVAGETPANQGFGAAALQIARAFRVMRSAEGDPAPGKRMLVPITFRIG